MAESLVMKRPIRLALPLVVIVLTFAVADQALPQAARTASSAARGPNLAVIVSVDGLNWDRLTGYRPYFTGGLKRLLDEGHLEQEARYRHLNTETAPGHASLGTGAPPRVTGIVANLWFAEKADGTLGGIYCTDQVVTDPATGERTVFPGPANLKVPTLGDRLVEASPSSRVVAVSGKDRGSIFLAGRNRAHAVYWFDAETGRFTSSAAYDTKSPGGAAVATLVTRYNKKRAGGHLPGRFGLTWKKLATPSPAVPEDTARPVPAADMALYQLPAVGLGWDHDLTRYSSGYFGGIFYSPYIDELVADIAVELLADKALGLGRHDAPDLLCLSFSGQDTVSHNYGPESEENFDLLRRLDVQLGRVFHELEKSLPGARIVIAFSADHGFTPIPEAARKRDATTKGGRVDAGTYRLTSFVDRLNRGITEELCLAVHSRPVHGVDGFNLKYDIPKLPLMPTMTGTCGPPGRIVRPEDIDRVLPGILRRFFSEEFSDVLLASQKDAWDPKDPAVEFARNSFDPARSGDAMLIPREGVLMGWDPARGTTHGSHFEGDIHVPLIFWGAGIPKKVSAVPSTPYDLAPTLGALLGVKLPDAVGRPLLPAK